MVGAAPAAMGFGDRNNPIAAGAAPTGETDLATNAGDHAGMGGFLVLPWPKMKNKPGPGLARVP